MIGVALSLGVLLYKSMRPRVGFLSRSGGRGVALCDDPGWEGVCNVTLVRFDGPLFFADASYLKDTISELCAASGPQSYPHH